MLILLLSIGCDRGQVEVDDSWRPEDKQIQKKPSKKKEYIVGETPADRLLRVFLSEESEVSLKGKAQGYGAGNSSFRIRNAQTGEQLLEISAGQWCLVSRIGGKWLIKSAGGADVWLSESAARCLVLGFGIGREDKNTETICSISSVSAGKAEDWRGYRGSIRLVAWSLTRFAVVNDVDIEEYLQGVVGSEVYSSWPDSVLEAQSIASRSYAFYHKQCQGDTGPDGSSNIYWDIGSDQGSQVYGGVSKEHVRVSQAVKRTAGVVLTYGPLGQRRLFPAYYSAVCGGHTQDAEVVFGDSIEPLSGCECGYCSRSAPKEKYLWADVSIAKSVVNSRLVKKYPPLSEIGRIVSISVAERSSYGRATLISLRGAGGRRRLLQAEKFRQAVSGGKEQLLSSWYSIADTGGSWRFENGRGWGHGVGLCQWGSYQMGLEGESCLEILGYYYRQAVLVRAY